MKDRINIYLKKTTPLLRGGIEDTIFDSDKYVEVNYMQVDTDLLKQLKLKMYVAGTVHFVEEERYQK